MALQNTTAVVGSGPGFDCTVSIEDPSGIPGEFIVLFQGRRDIADRLAACWNAQYSVPDNLVQAPIVGYIDATAR
jgi:hypothetical protein